MSYRATLLRQAVLGKKGKKNLVLTTGANFNSPNGKYRLKKNLDSSIDSIDQIDQIDQLTSPEDGEIDSITDMDNVDSDEITPYHKTKVTFLETKVDILEEEIDKLIDQQNIMAKIINNLTAEVNALKKKI
jgi:hypothetical protein